MAAVLHPRAGPQVHVAGWCAPWQLHSPRCPVVCWELTIRVHRTLEDGGFGSPGEAVVVVERDVAQQLRVLPQLHVELRECSPAVADEGNVEEVRGGYKRASLTRGNCKGLRYL